MTIQNSAPRLEMQLGGPPPRVILQRIGIDDGPWDDIGLLLSEESVQPGQVMLVKPDRLLTERRRLRGILNRYGINLVPNEPVRELLGRAVADDRAFAEAMRNDGLAVSSLDPCSITVNGRTFTRALRHFQLRDLSKLAGLAHGANFSVPGAGKTTVTYALHHQQTHLHRVNRLLVVAPLSAFGAWEEEAQDVFAPALSIGRFKNGRIPDADVILINYQRLSGALTRLTTWMSRHRVHLVIDEAHRAKRGAAGNWGRALLELSTLAVRRDILTGTPAPNHPKDLRALLNILWPGGAASEVLPAAALQNDPPMTAMADVARTIQPMYVRTNKEELQLPAVHITPVRVRLNGLQRDIYDAMLNRYAGIFDLDRRDSAMFSQLGEVMMYLLQAACSPKLLSASADHTSSYRYPPLSIQPGTSLARLLERYDYHQVPAKIGRACAIVRDNYMLGRKTLVWSNFPHNLLTLERQLGALRPALVYGSVPSDPDAPPGVRTRERELDRFRNDDDCMVLLANPAAMSEGVSLHHTCHDAIYIDRTFNAGQYLQSLDRIHRLGLRPDAVTRITLLIAEDTIDERVDRRVEEKTRRLSQMLSDPGLVQMALPDDEDYGDALDDPDDLEEVLRHLGEASASADGDAD
ncbi:DEAD/DEAH box helicase [Micromonospora sp. NPDC047527]|uniref:DEAD/DEAH box helicase n=1 Tax=Micromonospora sp. NPDC047527 TaxID=3155144 RepID=UPI0033E63FBF